MVRSRSRDLNQVLRGDKAAAVLYPGAARHKAAAGNRGPEASSKRRRPQRRHSGRSGSFVTVQSSEREKGEGEERTTVVLVELASFVPEELSRATAGRRAGPGTMREDRSRPLDADYGAGLRRKATGMRRRSRSALPDPLTGQQQWPRALDTPLSGHGAPSWGSHS
ncbi:hypothetical protein H920_07376 [Fukomys damarensis]|uniref:Uncharacterized protein n=1 Tax=Fukomys damarensis TaxID=885580 RepID=A0A091E7U0_FUKDA|nr:hypothetical protein H920_07376 [Fukomys damarensis]